MPEARQAWLLGLAEPLMTSEWALTEVASVLSVKQRTGQLDDRGRAVAARAVTRLVAEAIEVVGVQRGDFRVAADMAARPVPALGGADALHLAAAVRHGATFHTLDEGQAAAARARGIDAVVTVERD